METTRPRYYRLLGLVVSKTLQLATSGKWFAHDGHIISDDGHNLGSPGTRYYTDLNDRIREREANARLMAEAKRMYSVILQLQHTPQKSLVTEMHDIIVSVEGPLLAEPIAEEESYEHA
jgi:hypothetical protein